MIMRRACSYANSLSDILITVKIASTDQHGSSSKAVSLSQETLENLEFLLVEYRKKIVKQYASYVHCIRALIVDRGITVSELRSFLLSLEAFQSGHNVQCKLLSGVEEKLEEASTIYQILDIVTKDCASFLDFEIYQCIVDQYEFDNGQNALKYSQHLKDYIEYLSWRRLFPNYANLLTTQK